MGDQRANISADIYCILNESIASGSSGLSTFRKSVDPFFRNRDVKMGDYSHKKVFCSRPKVTADVIYGHIVKGTGSYIGTYLESASSRNFAAK